MKIYHPFKISFWLTAIATLVYSHSALSGEILEATTSKSPSAIPFNQLGAQIQNQSGGAGDSIVQAGEGARLKAIMQDLEGEATSEGLWIVSTADEDLAQPNRFRVRAMGIGRSDGHRALVGSGHVQCGMDVATWSRPAISEEYRVSADGIRQDFIVSDPPHGEGDLSVVLEISGARAESADFGARLIVDATGRHLAYHQLHVSDATGRELEASMEVADPERVLVRVNDAGARYPVRIDPTFSDADWVSMNPGIPGANDVIRDLAIDSNGNLYAVGDFTGIGTVSTQGVAKWDGTAWSPLGHGINEFNGFDDLGNGYINCVVVGENGMVYVGGDFETAGGAPAQCVAVWDGSQWSDLGAIVSTGVSDLALDKDGNLYAAGWFPNIAGGQPIAKWNGSVWSALGAGVDYPVYDLAVDSVGSLYAGGSFVNAGGKGIKGIAKWDGTDWSPLGDGIQGGSSALVVNSDGHVFAGVRGTVLKWDGAAWASLGNLDGNVGAVAVDRHGNVYAGGSFSWADSEYARRVAVWNGTRWHALGVEGQGVGGSGGGRIDSLIVDDTGTVYASGSFTKAGNLGSELAAHNVARWQDGNCSALGSGIGGGDTANSPAIRALAVDRFGNLVIGGEFLSINGNVVRNVAQWNGSTWSSLGGGMDNHVKALGFDSSGNLYAGGKFAEAGGIKVNYIAKWNGISWSALGDGLNSYVRAIAIDSNDMLYVGGWFNKAGGKDAKRIARWDGTEWSPLGAGSESGSVEALAVDSNGLVYAGGWYVLADGKAAEYIGRWDGNEWSALGAGLDGEVYSLVCNSDGVVYAGGRFKKVGGASANGIARWDGASWSPLGSGVGGWVYSMVFGGDGNLYAGGWFTTAGGGNANYIAKWDGIEWASLGTGVSGTTHIDQEPYQTGVIALVADRSGNLFVGGDFFTAGGKVSPLIAAARVVEGIDTRILLVSGNLSFGDVPAGQEAARQLNLFNSGNSSVRVDVIVYPSGFSGNWSGTIPAGGSQNVTVTFSPTVAQVYGGTITVNSDMTSGTNTIACSGTGVVLSFSEWAAIHGLGGPTEVTHGVPNLIRYAFGLETDTEGPSALPGATRIGGRLNLQMTEPEAIEGVIIGADYSTDLLHWFPLADTGNWPQHTFATPEGIDSLSIFVRWRVTLHSP